MTAPALTPNPTATATTTPAPSPAPPALELHGVCKVFRIPRAGEGAAADPRRERAGRHDLLHALRDVTFALPKGQALGVVGANGSGKSTLLKILAGVTPPDSGAFSANGQVAALLEVGAGFHPELSGIENVQLNGAVLGLGRREMTSMLHEIITFSGLERFMDMPVKHYSSGMTVRLGFAIASQLKPEILLLDETFAVGDAQFQARALARIREMKTRGVTLVLVSHTPELILELADRVIWLDHGRIAMDGDPADALAAYRRACGAHLMGCDHLSPAHMRARGREAGRILNASLLRVDGAAAPAAGPLPLESTEGAVIDFEVDLPSALFPAATPDDQAADLFVEAIFIRDDRRAVAKSRLPLQGLAQGRTPLRITIDPIRLAKGEYEIQLSLRRAGDPEPESEPTVVAPLLRITTPLPYADRLIADVPAHWM